MASYQINGMCQHCSTLDLYLCAKSAESLNVKIDRTASDVTATRKRNLRAFVFAKKRPDKIIGRTNPADVLVIHRYFMNI